MKNIIKKFENFIGDSVVKIAEHKVMKIFLFILTKGLMVLGLLGIMKNPLSPINFMFLILMALAAGEAIYILYKKGKKIFKAISLKRIVSLIRKKEREEFIQEIGLTQTVRSFQGIGYAKNIMLTALLLVVLLSMISTYACLPIFIWAVIAGAKIVIDDITRLSKVFA